MSRARDREILETAARENRVCITLDADFHAMLAVGRATGPSVIRIRIEGLNGPSLGRLLEDIWPRITHQVAAGAMVTVTEEAIRIHKLPVSR